MPLILSWINLPSSCCDRWWRNLASGWPKLCIFPLYNIFVWSIEGSVFCWRYIFEKNMWRWVPWCLTSFSFRREMLDSHTVTWPFVREHKRSPASLSLAMVYTSLIPIFWPEFVCHILSVNYSSILNRQEHVIWKWY